MTSGGTVRTASYSWTVDTAPPTAPLVSGSQAWHNATSTTATAYGSTDAGAGVASYQHQISVNGGATWSPLLGGASATATFEGVTLARFRALDKAGRLSHWTQVSLRLDRHGPSAPTAAGGTTGWVNAPVFLHENANAADALSGVAGYEVQTSMTAGEIWSSPQPVSGGGITDATDGIMLARFRAIDGAGNAGQWSAAVQAHLDTVAPALTAASTHVSWSTAASGTASVVSTSDDRSGVDPATVQYRTSTDGGATWSQTAAGSSVPVTAEGDTEVGFLVRDHAGNPSAWVVVHVRLDRTAPSVTGLAAGITKDLVDQGDWLLDPEICVVTGDGTGSGVPSVAFASSIDGGTTWAPMANTSGACGRLTAEGADVRVRARATDGAGNVGAWATFAMKNDHTAPAAPDVIGGSGAACQGLGAWVIGSGGTDALSGIVDWEQRFSTDGGSTWSVVDDSGRFQPTQAGTYVVEMRTVDAAGNISPWSAITDDATLCVA